MLILQYSPRLGLSRRPVKKNTCGPGVNLKGGYWHGQSTRKLVVVVQITAALGGVVVVVLLIRKRELWDESEVLHKSYLFTLVLFIATINLEVLRIMPWKQVQV